MGKIFFVIIFFTSVFMLSGCASNPVAEQSIIARYASHNRLNKYYELRDRYDNTKAVLVVNEDSDASWITNVSLWLTFKILPDLPNAVAVGGTLGMFYAAAWWLGVTLTGGGIMAVLAWFGSIFGGLPGIPPVLAGVLFLCAMFSLLLKIF